MDFSYLFEPYDRQVSLADKSFERIAGEFPDCIRCKPGCADCCHAVFGLFLVEAVFLKNDFDQLGETEKADALKRGLAAEKDLKTLERTLREFKDDPRMSAYAMAKTRIRCPLLGDDDACILYPYRPITCRVYGIPTMVQGIPRICGSTGFKRGGVSFFQYECSTERAVSIIEGPSGERKKRLCRGKGIPADLHPENNKDHRGRLGQ